MEQASQFVPKKIKNLSFISQIFLFAEKVKCTDFLKLFWRKNSIFTLKIVKVEIFLLKRLQGM
ncbi:hypothetical protein HMPREF2987_01800 [Streptococcus sp. HMSC067H01]|nr:hypothetical protein HMPREF2987_01800 [Streptococcus sp. HMSC067H01]